MQRIKRRPDFLAAASGVSWSTSGFLLQTKSKPENEFARVGFTCTKKLGNAVTRNRIKRRLREAARLGLADVALAATDYVIIGRKAAQTQKFEILKAELISAASKTHLKLTANKTDPT